MARMIVREVAWLGVALAAAFASAWVLRAAYDASDPRRAAVHAIRAQADAHRDVLVITETHADLVSAAAPLPTVSGIPPLADLTAFRRLYALAPDDDGLLPFAARLGTPSQRFGEGAARWDLDGRQHVVLDLVASLLDHATASREGGVFDGPCVRNASELHCHSTDGWNHVRSEVHTMGGVQVTCIFAHPQRDSRLVISARVPRARALLGIVGIDDAGYFPAAVPVTNTIRFEPANRSGTRQLLAVAPNKRGATPYRLDLGDVDGTLTFSITAPNADARQFCFTATLTR